MSSPDLRPTPDPLQPDGALVAASERGRPAALRAGSVPYLNVAPLVHGLEGRLSLLPPAELAPALASGRIDAGLLSITEALFHDSYDILDGPCVASDGEVYSVFLAHRRPLAEARSVACHSASLTSVNLLRVLLAEQGLHPALEPLSDVTDAVSADFVLLIGDPAIAFRRENRTHAIWDLGAAWKELTGLPFVYAAWVLRRGPGIAALRAELLAAARRGQERIEEVIRTSRGFDEAFRRAYLTHHTRHILGPREKEGITAFGQLLRRHLGVPVFEPRYVT